MNSYEVTIDVESIVIRVNANSSEEAGNIALNKINPIRLNSCDYWVGVIEEVEE